LEGVRKALEQEGLNPRKKERLMVREGKMKAYFDKKDKEVENALDGLSLK